MPNETFNKNIYTAPLLLSDLGYLILRIPSIISALIDKNINRGFIEKIMTVTSAVNGCSYCTWFHARQAIASGISEEEVMNMMDLQFHANASDFEIMALLYAQHYAETQRKPEEEMTRKFRESYDKKTGDDIYLFIRLINFGNLFGNTWDGIISRFKGRPAKNSSFIFESFFFLFTFWFMFPLMAISKERNNN